MSKCLTMLSLRSGLFVSTLAVLTVLSSVAQADVLVPPDQPFRGRSFEEWMVLWSEWDTTIRRGDGMGVTDTVDGVRFLPGGEDIEIDVLLGANTPFIVAPFPIVGELYADGSTDNPDDPIIPQFFETATITIVLDGVTLFDGLVNEFPEFLYGSVFFDEPIEYSETLPNNAVAALFALGMGTIYKPLEVGEHTLVSSLDSAFFGPTSQTYNITVVPEPASLGLLGLGAGLTLTVSQWRRRRN